MPKPTSDLEKYLAGEPAESPEVLPVVIFLVAILLVLVVAL